MFLREHTIFFLFVCLLFFLFISRDKTFDSHHSNQRQKENYICSVLDFWNRIKSLHLNASASLNWLFPHDIIMLLFNAMEVEKLLEALLDQTNDDSFPKDWKK